MQEVILDLLNRSSSPVRVADEAYNDAFEKVLDLIQRTETLNDENFKDAAKKIRNRIIEETRIPNDEEFEDWWEKTFGTSQTK